MATFLAEFKDLFLPAGLLDRRLTYKKCKKVTHKDTAQPSEVKGKNL
jgi:hypothetical protein